MARNAHVVYRPEILLFESLHHYLSTTVEVEEGLIVPVARYRQRTHEVNQVSVTVTNTAPVMPPWPKVVFIGVGLSIDRSIKPSHWEIETSKRAEAGATADHDPLTFDSIPTEAPVDERRHGYVLQPGESVRFRLTIPKEQMPADIRVHGSISRQHLFGIEKDLVIERSLDVAEPVGGEAAESEVLSFPTPPQPKPKKRFPIRRRRAKEDSK